MTLEDNELMTSRHIREDMAECELIDYDDEGSSILSVGDRGDPKVCIGVRLCAREWVCMCV